MPNVIGMVGSHNDFACGSFAFLSRRHDVVCRRRREFLVDYPSHGAGREMQSGPAKDVGDFDLTQAGTQGFQSLYRIAYKIRELVGWFGHLDQLVGSTFAQAPVPVSYGGLSDQEGAGRLFERPTPCRAEHQNGQSLLGGIMGPIPWFNSGHAGVFDAQFLMK